MSVHLISGWETECWKLARLFPEYGEIYDADFSSTISLRLVSSDPRLGSEGNLGFPTNGIGIEIRITNGYKETSDISGITLKHIDVSEAALPAPTDFQVRLQNLFNASVKKQVDLYIFRALREVERHLSEMWIQSVLDLTNAASTDTGLPDHDTGRLILTSGGRVILKRICCVSECMKCDAGQTDACFGFNEGGVAHATCSSGSCEWTLEFRPGHLYATGTMVPVVSRVSVWAICPCGKDCCFIPRVKIGKPSKAEFTCGCPNMDVTADYEPSNEITFNHRPRQSPKLKIAPSPTRKFKEGVALPLNGACKHYKKSFRWMKFNCCDEWYPCKQCHDARATGHGSDTEEETPPSSEMMCGFCSKQQPVASICIACDKTLTPGWSASEKVTTEKKLRPPKWKRRR